MKKVLFMLITGLIFYGTTGFAQDVHTLDTITVKAKKQVAAQGNMESINLKDEEKPGVSTIPDILDQLSGLDIQRRSILTPKSNQVRIRGLEEKRSLIMLDGRPLNGTGVMGGQFVDWSVLSINNWESVEVGKGAFSAEYGNTLGGTINMIPAKPEKEFEAGVQTGYKRYDTYSLGAWGSGRWNSLGTRLSAEYIESQGHLRNSQAERTNVSGDLYWFWGDNGEVKAGVRYTDGDFNMPVVNDAALEGYDYDFSESSGSYLIGPGISFPTGDRHGDGSYYNKKRTELDLNISKNIAGFDTQAKLYWNNEDRTDYIYSYNQDALVLTREAVPDRSWGWVTGIERLLGNHQMGFGVNGTYLGYSGSENTYIKEEYFPKPINDGSDDWDGTRWHGAYIDDHWTVLNSLDIYMGLRYEDYYGNRTVDQVTGYAKGKPAGFESVEAEFDESAFLPKLGLVFHPLEGLSLFGRFARATRFPDNPAFYWYYGGYRPEVDPNSNVERKPLTYEDAMEYEAGIRYSGIKNFSLSLSYYNYQIDDYIRWIFGYAPSRVVYNIDQVELHGIEMDMEGKIWENFSAFFNFTWQDTEKHGDVLDGGNLLSDKLSELPEFKFNLGLKYQEPEGIMAKLTLRWIDDREVPFIGRPGAPFSGSSSPDGAPVSSNISLKTLDSFSVVDMLVRYPLWKGKIRGFISGGVENMFDREYEEEYGFPCAGQTFHIGMEFNI